MSGQQLTPLRTTRSVFWSNSIPPAAQGMMMGAPPSTPTSTSPAPKKIKLKHGKIASKASSEVPATAFTLSLVEQQPLVEIVATTGEKYQIHKSAICGKSPYFNAVFNNGMLETANQSVALSDADGPTVGLLVHWAYTSQIKLASIDKDDEKAIEKTSQLFVSLAKLWLLGRQTLIPTLQNQVMVKINDALKNASPSAILNFARWVYYWDEDTESKLHLRAIHAIAFQVNPQYLRFSRETITSDLVSDVTLVLSARHFEGLPKEKFMEPLREKASGPGRAV